MEKRLISYIAAPFKIFGFTFKSIITLLFLASLFLNITMLVWQAGAFAVSAAFAGVTGISSVITGLKDTNDRLLKKNKSHVQEITKITDRIAKRTTHGALRIVAAIPAEVIPKAGAVVVVAVTAIELKEACDTMKDMTELNQIMGVDTPQEEETVCGLETPSVEEVMRKVADSPRAVWGAISKWELDLPSWEEWGNKLESMKDSIGEFWSNIKIL